MSKDGDGVSIRRKGLTLVPLHDEAVPALSQESTIFT